MFSDFARVWTPALQVSRLGRKPVRVVISGEPVVLFRGEGGRIGALIDRCPHRAVALSLGKVRADGCLECAFHGWRFSPEGENRGIPFNPDARLDRLGATSLPVRVLGEIVWIYSAPATVGPFDPPQPPPGLVDAGLSRVYVEREWACHWTRAMENMLDSPHLPFVHPRTIGRSIRGRMTTASRMEIDWEDRPFGGVALARLDGGPGQAVLSFHRPNVMALEIPIPGRRLGVYAMVIPSEPGRTRLIVAGSRDFSRLRLLDPWFAWLNGLIADEDKAVVESSGPGEVPPPGDEPSVATDKATLRFRKYYYDVLRGSSV